MVEKADIHVRMITHLHSLFKNGQLKIWPREGDTLAEGGYEISEDWSKVFREHGNMKALAEIWQEEKNTIQQHENQNWDKDERLGWN